MPVLNNIERLAESLGSTKFPSLTSSVIRGLNLYSLWNFFFQVWIYHQSASLKWTHMTVFSTQTYFSFMLQRTKIPIYIGPLKGLHHRGAQETATGKSWYIWIAKHSLGNLVCLIWDKAQAPEPLCMQAALLVTQAILQFHMHTSQVFPRPTFTVCCNISLQGIQGFDKC